MSKKGKGDMLPPEQEKVQEELHPLLQKIKEHQTKVISVIIIIILIAAGITGYNFYKRKTLQSAKSTFTQIINQNKDQEAIAALEDFLPAAPREIKQGIRFELAGLCYDQEEYAKSARYWEELAQSTEKKYLQYIAGMGRAKSLHLNGESEKALQILQNLVQQVPERFKKNINFELAAIAERNQNWEKALSAYKNIKADSDLTDYNQKFLDYKISQLEQKIKNQQ